MSWPQHIHWSILSEAPSPLPQLASHWLKLIHWSNKTRSALIGLYVSNSALNCHLTTNTLYVSKVLRLFIREYIEYIIAIKESIKWYIQSKTERNVSEKLVENKNKEFISLSLLVLILMRFDCGHRVRAQLWLSKSRVAAGVELVNRLV